MKDETEIQDRLEELQNARGLRDAEDHGRIQALIWVLKDE